MSFRLLARLRTTTGIYARMGLKKASRNLGRRRVKWFLNRHRGTVAIRFDSPGNGLFAHFTWCVHVCHWAAQNKRTVILRCSSPQYATAKRGEDWLPLLLKQPAATASRTPIPEIVVREFEDLPFFADTVLSDLALSRALFRAQFQLSDTIAAEKNRQVAALFGDSFPIGLHYRGTDKSIEAPRIPHAVAVASAKRALDAARLRGAANPVLFVASDEQAFIQFVKTELTGERVVWVDSSLRSEKGVALHHAKIPEGARLAQEALLDCLLLAHCAVLIKTASMLSAWSLVLGENTQVVLLSRPHSHCVFFPDNLAIAAGYPLEKEDAAIARSMESYRRE